MFKVNKKDTQNITHTIKTPARRHWHCFGLLIVKFKYVPHLFVVLLLFNWSMNLFAGNCASKQILILILIDYVIIHIRHMIYTVLHTKWNVIKLSIRKGKGKRGTIKGGKLFQMKEESGSISFNSYHTTIKITHLFLLL